MPLYLSVTPPERKNALRYTRELANVAYRIGPDSALLRRELPPEVRGGLLSVSDRDAPRIAAPERLCAAVLRECGRRSYRGVVLDFEEAPTPDRRDFARLLCRQLRNTRQPLFVPEGYSVPGAVTLINTAVSGGSFTQRLQEARASYGAIALDVERLAMDFPLPAVSGEGTAMSRERLRKLMEEEKPAVFFSPELCARYFTCLRKGMPRFILFDDADTIRRKLRLGASMGVSAAFVMYPEVEDLLPEIFKGGNSPGI